MVFRGWLSRLEWVSSDKEEFCRLDRLLISVAVEAGNQPGPEQVTSNPLTSFYVGNCHYCLAHS